MKTDAYYSNKLKCWVRLEREVDGEYCHTSGYATRDEALGKNNVPYRDVNPPSWLTETNDEVSGSW